MKPQLSVTALIDAAPRSAKLAKMPRDTVLSLRLPAEVKNRLQQLADAEGVTVGRFAQHYLDFLVEVTLGRAQAIARTVQDIQATYEKTVVEAAEWAQRLERAVVLVQGQRTAFAELENQYISLKATTLAGEIVKRTTAQKN